MKTTKITLKSSLFILICLFAGTACSDNSTGPNKELGEVTLTVIGDFENQATGQADFSEISSGIHIWQLNMNDLSPQTFSLDLSLQSSDPISRPGPGTYDIGFDATNASAFLAVYDHIVDEDYENSVEYSTMPCGGVSPGGTLTIESSSDEAITGSFEFDAASSDFDEMGNCVVESIIALSGEFTATPRIGI